MQRRDFLKSSLAGALFALVNPTLSGCNRQKAPAAEEGPYAVWREVQRALRSSPDHPVGRAQALVEQRDLTALHRFVRDEIRLVSGEGKRFAMGNRVTWGRRAALRAGAGTAREKAEILAELVRKAGQEAEVVEISAPKREVTPSYFFRPFHTAFEPPITEAQLANWKERLRQGSETHIEAVDIDATGAGRQTLTTTIKDALAAQKIRAGRYRYDNRPVGRVPVVKITQPDGTILLADPINPQGIVAPLPEGQKTWEASKPEEPSPVVVTLTAVTTDPTQSTLELLKGEWTVEELAGRQLRLGFQPTTGVEQIAVSRFADLRTFIPGMSLQALDGDTTSTTTVTGPAFNLGGDLLVVKEDGSVEINGTPLLGSGPLKLADGVTNIEVEADASRFPEVRLRVTPTDSFHKVVEGLPAEAFGISDQTTPVGFDMTSNRAAPRIIFLADQSLSMPQEFRGGKPSMEKLVETVRTIAQEIHPDAQLIYKPTQSNLWEQLAVASGQTATLIVYATDGDLDGKEPDEAMLAILKDGPPALLLEVDGTLEKDRARNPDNIFDAMAKATNGWAFPVKDLSLDDAASTIRKVLQEQKTPSYVFRYTAPSGSDANHAVKVVTKSAQGETVYQVPSAAALPRQIASLRLTVELGKDRVTRLIAGYNDVGEIRQSHLDEVRGALFGQHLLAFEGPPPSPSVLLDDMLQAKLGLETLDRANADLTDEESFKQALAKGFPILPGEAVTMLQRTGNGSGSDYSLAPTGLRTVLYSAYPVLNSDRFIQRVDILPLEFAAVLAENDDRMLELALLYSSGLAMAEAAMFETSTFSLLKDRPLSAVSRRPFRKSDLPPEKVQEWYQLIENLRADYRHPGAFYLGPDDGSVLALWSIRLLTGEVLGILPNGSGGGQTETKLPQAITDLDKVVAGLNLLATGAGAAGAVSSLGGVSLGIVAAYGQQLARLYAAVSLSIMLMDPSGIDPALRKAIATMACEVLKNIGLGVFSTAGNTAEAIIVGFATFENTLGVGGGTSPFACP